MPHPGSPDSRAQVLPVARCPHGAAIRRDRSSACNFSPRRRNRVIGRRPSGRASRPPCLSAVSSMTPAKPAVAAAATGSPAGRSSAKMTAIRARSRATGASARITPQTSAAGRRDETDLDEVDAARRRAPGSIVEDRRVRRKVADRRAGRSTAGNHRHDLACRPEIDGTERTGIGLLEIDQVRPCLERDTGFVRYRGR